MFPVFVLKTVSELTPTLNVALTQVSDKHEQVLRGDVLKIVMVNMSFMGPEGIRLRTDIKNVLASMVSADEARTCGLVVAPTVGEHGNTYSEDSIERASRDLLDDLRDESGMLVKPVTVMFDAETMWSESRGLTHNVYMCISKRLESGKLVSSFAKSKAFVRGALPELVKVLPRHEAVNPCVKMSTGDKANLSKERERKQWLTGPSFSNALAHGVWQGMGLNAKHVALWLDITAYDGHVPAGCILPSGVQVSAVPTEYCASIIWAQPAADNKSIEAFVEKKIMACLRQQCAKKAYEIDGAPDLAAASTTFQVGSKKMPTYSESDYKLSKPMADQSLALRKSFVDKWLAPNMPTSLKDEFRAQQVLHDMDFNKSGIAWEGDVPKRKAVDPADGAQAVVLAPQDGCPQTRADIQSAHGEIRLKEFNGWNLLVASDGAIFAECKHDVQLVLASEALAMASGEWVCGAEYDKTKKQGHISSDLRQSKIVWRSGCARVGPQCPAFSRGVLQPRVIPAHRPESKCAALP